MYLKKQLGINFVEVLITIVITSVGLLGIIALQLQANRSSHDSGGRTQAIWILEDLAARMNANSAALTDYATNGNYSCPNSAPTLCADYFNGTQHSVTSCTPKQVAAFDLWNAVCPASTTLNDVVIRQSAANFISNPILKITTNTAKKSAVISITWDVLTSGTTNDGNPSYIVDATNMNPRTSTLIREVQL